MNKGNKIKSLPNKEEAYKFGRKKGFGKALGLCIGFLRIKGIKLEEEMKLFVLEER